MSGLKSLFGKNVLGKGLFRERRGVGAALVNFGRLYHRIHSPTEVPSDKIIGGAPTRAPSPRRCHAGRLSPQPADQSGRSMVEMLAVLAIMGVLAIGGIAAYSFAVSKHRANQIYNQVDLRAVTAFSNPIMRQTIAGNTFFLPGFEDTFENLTYEQTKRERAAFEIKVSNVPQKVCKRLQDMTFKLPRQVTLNGEDISSTCGTQNTFVFVYDGLSVGKPSSGVDPIDCTCSGCQSCESGTCQDNDNLCGPKEVCVSGTCQCAPDYTECRGGCYTTCADGLIRDPISCDCVCEAQECPDHAVWDNDTCACVCDSPLIYDQDSHSCKCPADAPYYFEEANLCCKSGYTPVDGVCQKIDCRGGPTNYDCYINDKLCGYNCDSLGQNCQLGICYANVCAQNETFASIPFYVPGNYAYGCAQRKDEQTMCYTIYETKQQYLCSQSDENFCCYADSYLNCTRGECDTTCPEGWTYAYYDTNLGVCQKDKYLVCYWENNAWTCLKNHFICGRGCTDINQCGTCATDSGCLDGMTINPTTGRCENDVLECRSNASEDEIILSGGYQICRMKDTGENCGTYNYDKILITGACSDPGCPEGMVFGFVSGNGFYGCIDEQIGNEGMACYYQYDYRPNTCYYNGKLCGRRCDYDGANCGSVYLPQCALAGHCPQTGYNMSDGCTCDGQVTTQNGVSYCCPAGHTYVNGGCTLT